MLGILKKKFEHLSIWEGFHIVAQWVKLPCGKPASRIKVLVESAVALPFQFPANAPGEAVEDDSSTWSNSTHTGDYDGVPGTWLWTTPALDISAFWKVSQ